MDLHTWITQQVDAVEAAARRHEQVSPRWEYDPLVHEIRDVNTAGTVASVYRDSTGAHIARHDPATVLRRCEADRRILARHRLDPAAADSPYRATACDGCGVEWVQDYCDPVTDNLNDCPELLDLAHAHGLTPEILAGLDRPQPPKPTPAQQRRLRERARLTIPLATLRGPRWKPQR